MAEITIQDLKKTLDDVVDRLDRLTQIPPSYIQTTGLDLISHNLGLVSSGEFRSGNNHPPFRGFTGVRMGYPGFRYIDEDWQFVGVNNDVLQVGIRSADGKLYAGGGQVVIDEGGIVINQGGVVIDENGITVGGGTVILNSYGLILESSDVGHLVFSNDGGATVLGIMTMGTGGEISIVNYQIGEAIDFNIKGTLDGGGIVVVEDPGQANRFQAEMIAGRNGAVFAVGGDSGIRIWGHNSSLSGGNTYLEISDARSTPGVGSGRTAIYRTSTGLRVLPTSGNDALIVYDAGGIDVPNGNVRSVTDLTADDGVYSFTPSQPNGLLLISSRTNATSYGLFAYNTASPTCIVQFGGTNTVATTGVLTGTTGTDGKFTVSAHTDGKIYVENRIGSAHRWYAILI